MRGELISELAKAAAGLPVPARDSLKLKDPAKFRYIGKGETPLIDGFDITTGKAPFGGALRTYSLRE